MTILQLCDRMTAQGLGSQQQAVLLGVSALQVRMYSDGRTKTPGVRIALAVSRHITKDGKPLILDPYRGNQDVLDKVKDYETQCAQIVRDTGVGSHELSS